MLTLWWLCFRLLDSEAQDAEQVGEGVEGVAGVLGVLEAVKVVHIVSSHNQQQHAGDELQGVGHPIEVPH